VLDLAMWNLINKFNFLNPFKSFSHECKTCGRIFSETFFDYYIENGLTCKRCKIKAKLFSPIITSTLNLVASGLNMPLGEFKNILRENIAIKRMMSSYMEGFGIFGLRVPQIAAGPVIAIFSITDQCNLNCSHCYLHKNTGNGELTFEEACKFIDQLHEAKTLIVAFSGGEPLLREDIFDLMKYITDKQMRVAMATNGISITKHVAQMLKESGAGYIQISIDGLEELHDDIRGKGNFQKALEGIKNCLDIGLYVSMDVVITKRNVNQIHELVSLAKELRVQKLELLDFVPSEKARNLERYALLPLQIEKFGLTLINIWEKLIKEDYPLTLSYKNPIFNRILAQRNPNTLLMPIFKATYPKKAIQFFNFSNRLAKGVFNEQNPFSPFITGCESGIYIIHVKPNGEVTPCPLNPKVIGNVKKQDIKQIWLLSPVLNKYRNVKRFKDNCGKCVYNNICGGCRAKVYLYKNSYTGSDPTCFLNNK